MANTANSGALGGRSRGRMPTKRSINFAEIGKKKTNYLGAVPIIIVVLIIGALVAKFGIMDRLEEVTKAEAATAELQAQLNQAYSKVESFGSLTNTYAQYTFRGMTNEEVTMADRVEILDLIDRVIVGRCNVDSWELSGNELVVNVTVDNANDLRQLNLITNELKKDTMVQTASLTNSKSSKKASTEEGQEEQYVTTGRLKVVLKKKEVLMG